MITKYYPTAMLTAMSVPVYDANMALNGYALRTAVNVASASLKIAKFTKESVHHWSALTAKKR